MFSVRVKVQNAPLTEEVLKVHGPVEKFSGLLIACALCYSVALILTINGASLWTDEAFSAWMASHKDIHSFWASLFAGDSSDLQMGLYYLYLFGWVRLFGMSEVALRTANIPFILLFAWALIWASQRIFHSRAAWLSVGMLPFIWRYASEARPYMAILALSTAATASLFGFLHAESHAAAKRFPWVVLTCITLGCLFHMLFLLALPPMLLVLAFASATDRRAGRWHLWMAPLAFFAAPFAAIATFLGFTFLRHPVDYVYPVPGLKEMASVAYELTGLGNFGPNRKLGLDFRAYAVPLALGGIALIAVAVGIGWLAWKGRQVKPLPALAAAAGLSIVEVLVLAWMTKKQFDSRHVAALVPIVLFLLLAIFRGRARRPGLAAASMVVLGAVWFASDLRGLFLPEYQREDYRDAVTTVSAIHRQRGGEILLASDPVGPAYYGLDVRGPAPCYPIVFDCTQAFQKTQWPHDAPALDADSWGADQIREHLATASERGIPVIVLHRLARSHRESPWWPALASYSSAQHLSVHGFEIVVLSPALFQ